jgi:hypothetical protein
VLTAPHIMIKRPLFLVENRHTGMINKKCTAGEEPRNYLEHT